MSTTYKIGEAATLLNLKTYVLRFWETEFSQIAPLRTDKGQRLYGKKDLALLERIRFLLHERGLTIEGARKVLAEERERGVVYSFGVSEPLKTWEGGTSGLYSGVDPGPSDFANAPFPSIEKLPPPEPLPPVREEPARTDTAAPPETAFTKAAGMHPLPDFTLTDDSSPVHLLVPQPAGAGAPLSFSTGGLTEGPAVQAHFPAHVRTPALPEQTPDPEHHPLRTDGRGGPRAFLLTIATELEDVVALLRASASGNTSS